MIKTLELLGIQTLRGTTRVLPRASGLALGRALGRGVYRAGMRRRVSLENVGRALATLDPRQREAIARSAYEHVGMVIIELMQLPHMSHASRRARVEFEGREHLDAALARGRGAIVASAHYGNWEFIGAGGVAHGLPVTFVVQRMNNARVDSLLNRTRESLGIRVLERGMALRRMREEIAANRLVAIMCDQDARRRGIFVPFFGVPASTHKGAAQLALRLGAPFIPLFGRRLEDGRHRLLVHEALTPRETRDEASAVHDMMARFNTALEATIRADPTQYLWMHRRWKTSPLRPTAATPQAINPTAVD